MAILLSFIFTVVVMFNSHPHAAGTFPLNLRVTMHKLILTLTAAVSLIMTPLAHAKEFLPTYTVTVLPLPQGHTRELITQANNHGDSVGVILENYDNAVVIHNRKATNIIPSLTANSYANAVNNDGTVVGEYYDGQKFLGFIYRHRTLVSFQPHATDLETDASALNDIGQVAGYFSPAGLPLNSADHIYIRQANGTFQDLGEFGVDPYAATINDQGRVLIGTLDPDMEHTHAFISRPGSNALEQIPPLVPGASVSPAFMNQFSVVVGAVALDTTGTKFHAFIYFEGKMKDLGALPDGIDYAWASGINNLGQITGVSLLSTAVAHVWVNFDGKMRDVNTLLNANATGWEINDSYFINDRGQIVCGGTFQGGSEQSVILTPSALFSFVAF